ANRIRTALRRPYTTRVNDADVTGLIVGFITRVDGASASALPAGVLPVILMRVLEVVQHDGEVLVRFFGESQQAAGLDGGRAGCRLGADGDTGRYPLRGAAGFAQGGLGLVRRFREELLKRAHRCGPTPVARVF